MNVGDKLKFHQICAAFLFCGWKNCAIWFVLFSLFQHISRKLMNWQRKQCSSFVCCKFVRMKALVLNEPTFFQSRCIEPSDNKHILLALLSIRISWTCTVLFVIWVSIGVLQFSYRSISLLFMDWFVREWGKIWARPAPAKIRNFIEERTFWNVLWFITFRQPTVLCKCATFFCCWINKSENHHSVSRLILEEKRK